MGPKKKAADEGEDLSAEQFMKQYKKNCALVEMPISKLVKEKYDTEYLEEGNPITKVRIVSYRNLFIVVSHLGPTRLARSESFNGRTKVSQLPTYKEHKNMEGRCTRRRSSRYLRIR